MTGQDDRTITLVVTGMRCDRCAGHVERALRGVAGVQAVAVERAAGVAAVRVRTADAGAVGRLVNAVEVAGYGARAELALASLPVVYSPGGSCCLAAGDAAGNGQGG